MVVELTGCLPSGKRLHNYGKSSFLMGKPTIKWQCSMAMLNYQRVTQIIKCRVKNEKQVRSSCGLNRSVSIRSTYATPAIPVSQFGLNVHAIMQL